MATLTVSELDHNVANDLDALAVAASAGGDEFENDGETLFFIRNAGGGAINLTLNYLTGGLIVDQQTVSPYVLSIPAGGRRVVGNFQTSFFNTADGRVAVSYSGVTSVTVLAFRSKTG